MRGIIFTYFTFSVHLKSGLIIELECSGDDLIRVELLTNMCSTHKNESYLDHTLSYTNRK
jgi:hypothetical protein